MSSKIKSKTKGSRIFGWNATRSCYYSAI